MMDICLFLIPGRDVRNKGIQDSGMGRERAALLGSRWLGLQLTQEGGCWKWVLPVETTLIFVTLP